MMRKALLLSGLSLLMPGLCHAGQQIVELTRSTTSADAFALEQAYAPTFKVDDRLKLVLATDPSQATDGAVPQLSWDRDKMAAAWDVALTNEQLPTVQAHAAQNPFRQPVTGLPMGFQLPAVAPSATPLAGAPAGLLPAAVPNVSPSVSPVPTPTAKSKTAALPPVVDHPPASATKKRGGTGDVKSAAPPPRKQHPPAPRLVQRAPPPSVARAPTAAPSPPRTPEIRVPTLRF